MRQSELFTKTRREPPKDEESLNARLLIRAGFIHKEMAGVYSFLPLGLRVLNKIIEIIREEMNRLGSEELLLTALQNPEVWKKTDRWDEKMMDIWFKTKLKEGEEVGLGATHEEPLTSLMRRHVASWRDLPVFVYQFQTKFRNELRARSGLLRMREFLMKDLYSFCRSLKEHEEFYERVKQAYYTIFDRIGIGSCTVLAYASGGSFSKYSHEFQTLCDAGEDTVFVCEDCSIAVNKEIRGEQKTCPQCGKKALQEHQAVEVGNIFSLGTRFSESLGLEFTDEKGATHPVVMGSYGIGPARAMAAAVELFHDEKGILWPSSIAPFDIHLLSFPGGEKNGEGLYQKLEDAGFEVLYDDRGNASPGEKLADADLIGIPWRVIESGKTAQKGQVEVKERSGKTEQFMILDKFLRLLKTGKTV